MPVFQLSDRIGFPPPHLAEQEGLLAVGGDLRQERLLLAYKMGIFPWYSEDDPIIWWSPDPRLVLYPRDMSVSRSLNRVIKKKRFRVTTDQAFEQVIRACAAVRMESGEGTWLVDEMVDAYCRLHRAGFAHSAEAWDGDTLAGGLYGVSLGRSFFGESMFMRVSNASKVAFVTLVRQLAKWHFDMIDCQVKTDHLMRFGAREISRRAFLGQLEKSLKYPTRRGRWHFDEES
ncbi:leucyl/phenylalanyl-tRNA--protein transferase [Desulfonema ishimotonii]|uniref:Leucyl/phenylalanyl-tRNA--protein transferase n=1 Tax=Desulfonema ishimotonii TaxID=45657 RepID=A0A401FXJ5_9BACT|nr:leucyl/phenylalanyl-tRNA--protein transferase [Desulfonema ishimotonii]GBC61669.1 leucyl/phenylalanyl-tRNA--protein transferase [Desulfonema ishimotonii]